MTKKLKTPADYAQFSFRIGDDSKKELSKRLERILKKRKSLKDEAESVPKKNELIIEALNIGLIQIEKLLGLK